MDSSKPCYRVVAALIEREDRFLVTQRRPDARLALLWEFPGGRVEPGEADPEALRRELKERMDVEVEVGSLFLHVARSYKGYDIDFWVYRCRILGADPRPVAVHAIRWVTLEDLGELPFPGVDQETVDALVQDDVTTEA